MVLTPEGVDPAAVRKAEKQASKSQARAVKLEGAGAAKTYDNSGEGISPGAPTDAEVKADLKEAKSELRKFKKLLSTTAYLQTGPRARVLKDGTAVAPEDAPEPVKRVIQAGNAISKLPYKWGGGHGAWRDTGYDCSGSVSFALAGAGLLRSPLASGPFMKWGGGGARVSGSPSTPTPATSSWWWRGCDSDTSGQGRARARAGRRRRAAPAASPCATYPAFSRDSVWCREAAG